MAWIFPNFNLRVKREGVIQAIKFLLIDRDENSFSFMILKAKGRLDRTIEQFWVNNARTGLFTDSEIKIAQTRLEKSCHI